MGLGIPAFLYGLLTLWIVVHGCRQKRKAKMQNFDGQSPSDVTLTSMSTEKTASTKKHTKAASGNSKTAQVQAKETTKA